MTNDYLTMSCNPAEEEWPSGGDFVEEEQRRVLQDYLLMLIKKFPIPEDLRGDVSFGRKTFPHDFGSYTEVVVRFNRDNPRAVQFAYMCDNNMPGLWTDTEVVNFEEYMKKQEERVDEATKD